MATAYQQTVLADAPVGFWPLNELSGTVAYDLSGNGNNAAYTSGITLNNPSLSAGLPVCANLTGTGSYISGPTSPVNIPVGNSAYTLEIWASSVWTQTQYSANGAQLLGYGGYGTTDEVNAIKFMANANATGNGFVNYWWGNDFGPTGTFNLNQTYHLVATFDGTTRSLYVNGVLYGSDTPTGHNVTTAANITIGSPNNASNNTESIVGYVSNVAIYPTALSAARILAHYNSGLLPPLIANMYGTGMLSSSITQLLITHAALLDQGKFNGITTYLFKGTSQLGSTTSLEATISLFLNAATNAIGSAALEARLSAIFLATSHLNGESQINAILSQISAQILKVTAHIISKDHILAAIRTVISSPSFRIVMQKRNHTIQLPKRLFTIQYFIGNNNMQNFSPKSAEEIFYLSFDFTNALVSGATISSATCAIVTYQGTDSNPQLVLSGQCVLAGNQIIQEVTGGVVGVTYAITATVTISTGEIVSLTGILPITWFS